MYLGVTTNVVSSVLLKEVDKQQKSIWYMSKVLQGVEWRYLVIEKATLALVYTTRKLIAYF